jgi:hypothetical protein
VRDTSPAVGCKTVLSVQETASFLGVSASWVRRHLAELPVVPMPGRLVRIDSAKIQGTMMDGKSLKPQEPTMVNRFQRGRVYERGKKKMWYGRFRLETLDAKGEREISLGDLGRQRRTGDLE